jgi:hypothetical protein
MPGRKYGSRSNAAPATPSAPKKQSKLHVCDVPPPETP